MSKAFTKEDDGAGADELPPYDPPWPKGARNYVTAGGYARLMEEREALAVRPPSSLSAEEKRRLQVLGVHLEAAEIVELPTLPMDEVRFGAVVRVGGDRERSYAIVGVDEIDVAKGRIAWLSPIARALTGRRVGDEVVVRTPRGEEELVILAIEPLPA